MSTLAEIEAAAVALPTPEKEELIRFLHRQLEREREAKLPERRMSLTDFAGIICLAQDPLAWQQAGRGEWR